MAKSRALRRHHRFRLWWKRRHYYGGWAARSPKGHVVLETPTLCSCILCSRSKWRKMGAVTHQEKVAELDAEEQCTDLPDELNEKEE